MVRGLGKGKASASKSKSKKIVLVSGEPELSKRSMEETVDDISDEVDIYKIDSEGESSLSEGKRNETISGPVDGNGHEEEQLGILVNDEEKDAVYDTSVDRSEDVLLCRQKVEILEEVSVGFGATSNVDVAKDEERINEVVPNEDNKQIHNEFGDKNIEDVEEMKSSELTAQGYMNINEGASASEYGTMEERLVENMQIEEASKVDTVEPMGTPEDDGKTESTREDASITNDVKSVTEKTDRPKRKVLKKKVVKKAVLVQDGAAPMDESKLQSLIENEASDETDKAGRNEDVKNEEKAVPADIGEEMTSSELAEKMQIDEANKVNAEEPTGTPTDSGKTKCTGDDATLANDVKSVPQKIDGPKRKISKKRVVKKKMVVRNDVAPMEAAKSQSLIGNEASGETNTADANADVMNEEKMVHADKGKMKLKGEEASAAGSVKADPEKANQSKRKMLMKKVGAVASVNEAIPQSVENDASGEANQTDTHKEKNDDKAEVTPAVRVNKNLKRRRKKAVTEGHASTATAGGEQKTIVTINEVGNKENKEIDGQDLKNGKEVKSGDRVSHLNKRKRKKTVKEDNHKMVADGINNLGSSENTKSSRRTESMGMIFMCNSETKKDCYQYKVLGLPGNKKDTVSKIYKGMRLFLFDVTKRMMHGIYKADGPGGYNIEPRAFKSEYPSQVRFSVLKDCLPLPEEKFKKAIKDNYYKGNRFHFELTNEQVKHLCKLFTETSKRTESNPPARTHIPATPSSSRRDRKRKGAVDIHKAGGSDSRKKGRISTRDRERSRRRARDEVRHAPVVFDDRYHRLHPVVYERESYLPSAVAATAYQHVPVQNPPRTASYPYNYVDVSRVDIDNRRLSLPSSQNWERSVAAPSNLASYVPYRETLSYWEPVYETSVRREVAYENAYREPIYETSLRREPVYETSVRREAGYEDASLRPAEYYRTADYRPPLPPYRRY